MKKTLALTAIIALAGIAAFGIGKFRTAETSMQAQADTVYVNTTDLCKDIIGYNGPTPLIIKVVDGVVVKIEALPNDETPGFFRRVVDGGLLEAPVGLTIEKAATKPYDAVTGATYSSIAVIRNIKSGLKTLLKDE